MRISFLGQIDMLAIPDKVAIPYHAANSIPGQEVPVLAGIPHNGAHGIEVVAQDTVPHSLQLVIGVSTERLKGVWRGSLRGLPGAQRPLAYQAAAKRLTPYL
jgi:hypothetical protein